MPPSPFWKYGADKPFFNILRPGVTLKKGQDQQNQISSCTCPKICASLVLIHPFLLDTVYRHGIYQNSKPHVTLKMGSRLTKSNHFLSMSQKCICASLVNIFPFIHEIGRSANFKHSKTLCDLKNRFKVTKNLMRSFHPLIDVSM